MSRDWSDGGRRRALLDRVCFDLEEGRTAGIYGTQRSGKSTLLRLACGLEMPDGGAVRFRGREIAAMKPSERAQLLRGPIALVAPAAWLPGPGETVLDHVVLSLGSMGVTLRDARRLALAELDRLEVAGVAGESAAALSGAERARVMLASALVREPQLLLADEPAPLPSPSERERFLALMRGVAADRGIALLVASEEMMALQGLQALMSLSVGELCSPRPSATVVALPARRAGTGGAP